MACGVVTQEIIASDLIGRRLANWPFAPADLLAGEEAQTELFDQLLAGSAEERLAVETVTICTYNNTSYRMSGISFLDAVAAAADSKEAVAHCMIRTRDHGVVTIEQLEGLHHSLYPGHPLPPEYQCWRTKGLARRIAGAIRRAFPKAEMQSSSPQRPHFTEATLIAGLQNSPKLCRQMFEAKITEEEVLAEVRRANEAARLAYLAEVLPDVTATLGKRAEGSGFYLGLRPGWLVDAVTRAMVRGP